RDAGNDIRLPEAAVSSRHAVIITRSGHSTVHDLNSSNGTWINGKRVESQALQHGDVVQFGRLSMNFVDESSASSGSSASRGSTQKNATVSIDQPQLPVPPPSAAAAKANVTGLFKAPPAPAAPQLPPDAPDLAELDRLMGSIRTYRSSEEQLNAQKKEEMLAEWKKVMSYCAALKTKLSAESRVRYFEISDRRNEVVIRIERTPGQPTQLLMLTWGHIDQRAHQQDGIWLRQPSQSDKRYEKCSDVMRDLVTTVAHMLV
ncbi:MAG: FHA domain-containing protein, partial [Verrucomicrobia bacterium]|nr:FHA domain-containing protein [Verrucomicrobiota bacterium]